MKLAIVFDDLIQFGGAERLLLAAHDIWPQAPIYTSVASKNWQALCLGKNIDLRVSWLQKMPFAVPLNRVYASLLFHLFAFESFDFSKYDVVLSISSRFAHGVITKPSTIHICYINSPGRMFWEPFSYFEKEGIAKRFFGLLNTFLSHIRIWDYTVAQRVDHFISNSLTPQKRVQTYYGRDSKIIFPFINSSHFDVSGSYSKGDFYLVVSRLVAWKKIDIAIEACAHLGIKLRIAGTGPDEARLRQIAKTLDPDEIHVKFLGSVSESEKIQNLKECIAVINTQFEDFGLVPLESMASGTPVIAFGKGGALETVIPGKTGEFFYEHSSQSLKYILQNFDRSKYNENDCKIQASKYSYERFKSGLKEFVSTELGV